MVFTNLFAGEIVTELLKQLVTISQKSCLYKSRADRLITNLNLLIPLIDEAKYSGVEMSALRQSELDCFLKTLRQGLELAQKVLASSRWSVCKNLILAGKMEKLEKKISRFIEGPMKIHLWADVHRLRFENIVRLDHLEGLLKQRLGELKIGVCGGGGCGSMEEAIKKAEEEDQEWDGSLVNLGLDLGKKKVKEMVIGREDLGVVGICGIGAREFIRDEEVRSKLKVQKSIFQQNLDENSPKKEENSEVAAELCDRVLEVTVFRDVPESTRSAPAESNGCSTPSGGVVGGGIKGVRPPLLKPPPSNRLPEIDKTTSTWDPFKDFGPIDEINSLTRVIEECSSDDEEEHPEEEEEKEVKEDKKEVYKEIVQEQEKDSEARLGVVENEPPSESCSFTTANDDEASSSTTEPSSNISPNGRFKRNITSWQKGDLLGRGSFGSVYEGIAEDGFFFAVKEVCLLDEGSQGKQSVTQLEQEIALLSQFEHENIVQYYGTETDESKLYIFLELVTKGSLQNLYQKYILQDTQVSAYTKQILQGLKYLHDRNVVHRDIKCANILVDASGSVKLADFGLAKATTKLNDVKSCKGTAFWMAPEVVNRKNQGYGLPADIWSLGCTVLEMLTQKIPYSELEGMQALFRIGKGVPPSVPDSLSNDARDFIWKCLQVNPDARATAAGLLNHSFVKRSLPTSSGSAPPFLLAARSC